jgi:hypothetical protein
MKATVLTRCLSVLALFGMMTLVSCEKKSSVSSATSVSNKTSSSESGFSFNPVHPSSVSSVVSSSSSSSSSESHELVAYTLADINKDGDYLVEGEDCDTSNCTLQTGCAGFFEYPATPTSNNECIAAICSPSILAFKFNVQADCSIQFFTTAAKYENPYDLDSAVQYYVDNEKPFVTDYTEFGHTDTNLYYNWKKIPVGNMNVKKGLHQFNVKVLTNFPNTDCFNLVVTNYTAA